MLTPSLSLVALFKLFFYESGHSDYVPCRCRLSSPFLLLPFEFSTQGTGSCCHRLIIAVLLSRLLVAVSFPLSFDFAISCSCCLFFCRLLFLLSFVFAVSRSAVFYSCHLLFRCLLFLMFSVTAISWFAMSRSSCFLIRFSLIRCPSLCRIKGQNQSTGG